MAVVPAYAVRSFSTNVRTASGGASSRAWTPDTIRIRGRPPPVPVPTRRYETTRASCVGLAVSVNRWQNLLKLEFPANATRRASICATVDGYGIASDDRRGPALVEQRVQLRVLRLER